MNIRVIQEVLRCSKCKKKNTFLYLSDFAYGERLIRIDEAKKYVYINLLEDKILSDYEKLVRAILKEYNYEINEETISNIINKTFGIACDKIMGNKIDFSHNEEKCSYCFSNDFDSIMAEPETILDISVPVITHEQWNVLSENKRKELIENELKLRKIL